MTAFAALHEKDLQRLVRAVLSDTRREWATENGARVQVLSVGEWNHAAGPDFLDMAIVAEGGVHVGNAEFHRTSSDWDTHEHSLNPSYVGLLLHIVLKNNTQQEFARYTLVVPEEDVERVYAGCIRQTELLESSSPQGASSQEARELLQSLARQRMEYKADYALSILNPYKPHETLIRLLGEFGERQRTKKRRPRGTAQIQIVATFLQNTPQNQFRSFLENFLTEPPERITPTLSHLLEKRITTEGAGTRQELIVNILLPLALALCKYSYRRHTPSLISGFRHEEELWLWYFALHSRHSYALLQERFPAVSQALVFEQQGLLQYLDDLAPLRQSAKPARERVRAISAHIDTKDEYIITLYAS